MSLVLSDGHLWRELPKAMSSKNSIALFGHKKSPLSDQKKGHATHKRALLSQRQEHAPGLCKVEHVSWVRIMRNVSMSCARSSSVRLEGMRTNANACVAHDEFMPIMPYTPKIMLDSSRMTAIDIDSLDRNSRVPQKLLFRLSQLLQIIFKKCSFVSDSSRFISST